MLFWTVVRGSIENQSHTNTETTKALRAIADGSSSIPQARRLASYPQLRHQLVKLLTSGTSYLSPERLGVSPTNSPVGLAPPTFRIVGPRSGECRAISRERLNELLPKQQLPKVDAPAAITFVMNDLSCGETENLRSAEHQVNSTYVSGTRQLVNHEYVALQAQINHAQQELFRLQNQNNSFNAFAIGFLQGRIGGFQRLMANTNPFLYQNIDDSYQYQEFVAQRRMFLHATGTVVFDMNGRKGARALSIESAALTEDAGRSGVLPQDTRNDNKVPKLRPIEDLRQIVTDEFSLIFGKQVKLARCEWASLVVGDAKASALLRMETALSLAADCDTLSPNQKATLIRSIEGCVKRFV